MTERLPRRISEKLVASTAQEPTRLTLSELSEMTKKREGKRDLVTLPPGFVFNASLLVAGRGSVDVGLWKVPSPMEVAFGAHIVNSDSNSPRPDNALFEPVFDYGAEDPNVTERRADSKFYWSWLEQQPPMLEKVFQETKISPHDRIYIIRLLSIIEKKRPTGPLLPSW